jgi:sigma-B regulation protein RsbU (phosphoserine phosphatase)
MSTSVVPTRQIPSAPAHPPQDRISDLLKLHRAAQKLTSILDLEPLIDRIVNEVARSFGFQEVTIYLRHPTRDEVVLTGVHGCTLHDKGASFAIGEEGIVGHVASTGDAHYAPDVRIDPYYVACEPSTLSEVGIPLKANGRVIGVFAASHCELDAFQPAQLQLLKSLTEHVAIAIDNAQTFEQERKQNRRMTREADEAREIQQALLPKTSLFLPNVSVSGASLPAGAVGGDWYDYIELENGKWGIVLADVSGKGMAAAMLMSATRGLLRSLAETIESPGEVLSRLNRVLLRDFPTGRFVTMIYAVLDPAMRTLTFASAGHLWPLVNEGGCSRFVETESGLPLGLAETAFAERTILIPTGSRVLFYSDGIVEAVNEDREEYGSARLAQTVASPAISTELILQQVNNFAVGEPGDDATVVLITGR